MKQRLDEAARAIMHEMRNGGSSWAKITRTLRQQGYTQARGGRLTSADLCNFVRTTATARTNEVTTTTTTDINSFVKTVVKHPTWSAEKKVRVIEAAL